MCSSRPRAEQHLVRWADSQFHDMESLSKMVDPSIRGECSVILLSRFADIISGCIRVILSFLTLHAQVSMQNCLCPISLQLQHKHHKHPG
jgi:hypothetical protein